MPQGWLAYDPERVLHDDAVMRAVAVGCSCVVTGLNRWMLDQGIKYGPDGYVAVVVCGVPAHSARREVLATFTGNQINNLRILSVSDHPPDPPTQLDLDRSILNGYLDTTLTTDQIQNAIKLLISTMES